MDAITKLSTGESRPSVKSPLDILLILEPVLAYCPTNDLKACRQVSRLWRDASQKAFTLTTRVDITGNEKMTQFLSFLAHKSENEFSNFFTNVWVYNVMFDDPKIYHEFCMMVWNYVKILKLINCSFPTRDALKQIIFKYCANVEQLDLHWLSCNEDAPQNFSQFQEPSFGDNKNLKFLSITTHIDKVAGITWIELFNQFPRLEVLVIADILPFEDVAGIFLAVGSIRQKDPTKLKLKEIWGFPSAENVASLLSDSNQASSLTLEKLSLKLRNPSCAAPFKKILGQQGPSLKRLILSSRGLRGWLNPNDCFSCPRKMFLENLTELEIVSGLFTSLEFLKFTPNLRKLTLRERVNSFDSMFVTNNFNDIRGLKLEKCVELRVFSNIVTSEQTKILIEIMPNLKRTDFVFDPITRERKTDLENHPEKCSDCFVKLFTIIVGLFILTLPWLLKVKGWIYIITNVHCY